MTFRLLHKKINPDFSNKIRLRVLGTVFLSIFMVLQSFGQSFILDLQYNPMTFTNGNKTILVNNGNTGSVLGTGIGSVHKYSNVITVNGITVYAKMTILDNHNAKITNFDDDTQFGVASRFQPRIGSTPSDGGYVTYQLEFFDTKTDYPVYIYNYYMTVIDNDGDGSNREFVEVGGYSSYQTSSQCKLTITPNTSTGRTRFLGVSPSLNDITFENTASFIANYLNANNRITFTLGQTGPNAERYYSVQFGAAGGTLTNPVIVPNPLPVAIDDNANVNYFSSGSPVIAIPNVLSNDLYNGSVIDPSQVTISLITAPSNPGVVLNTSTGQVTVAPGTLGGTYTLTYQVSMKAAPSNVDIATVTINVLQADLVITKSVTPSPVVAGQNVNYNISVTNNGPTDALMVAVSDPISSNLTVNSTTPSIGNWSAPTWTIGTLAHGTTATLTINAKVLATFSGALNNTATVSSNTPDPNTSNNTASANLSVTALSGPTAKNINVSANLNTTVDIDVLTSNVAQGSGVIVPGSLVLVGTPPNSSTVGAFTVDNTTHHVKFIPIIGFTGPATINYQIFDANGLSSTATITCTITGADLEITKTAALSVVGSDQFVTYTLTAKNNGPNDAVAVSISDPLPANVTYSSATNPTAGAWDPATSKWTISTLSNGTSATLKITDKVTAAYTGTLSNTATITSTTGDPSLSNNTAIVTTQVTALKGPTAVNDNASTSINTFVKIPVLSNDLKGSSDIDPTSVTFVTGTIPPSTTGNFVVDPITGEVTFTPFDGFTGTATITYQMKDVNGLASQATITVTITNANLTILKTAGLTTENGVQKITYSITVTNNGTAAASNVSVTDNLPSSVTYVSNTATAGTTWSAPTWTIPTLAVNGTATLSIVTTVNSSLTGTTVTNTASAQSPTTPTVTSSVTTDVSKPNLTILKTAGLTTENGVQKITYSITVTNNGTAAASNVSVTDNLPSSVTYVSNTATAGTTWSAPTWSIPTLAVNGTATLSIVNTVNSSLTGTTITNTASAQSPTTPTVTSSVTTTVLTSPTALDDNTTTTVNTAIPITVLSNDVQGSGILDVTSVTILSETQTNPTLGTFVADHVTGVVTFTPANGLTGTTTIKYQVLDVNGISTQATITVIVTPSLINNFPASGYGTLAFEDLWPALGDYDCNDLVLDYKFQVTTNANNKIEQIIGTFIIKAFGASLENGFGFQLPSVIKSTDLTVSGYSLKENFIHLNDNGTEAGQANSTIIVYDNAYKQMTSPGGTGVNTDPTQPYVTPKTLTITINVTPDKYSYSDLDISNFNPFLIVNKVRGVEVHLPDFAPTSLANTSLFGTADDKSDPAQHKYYKNANNLPWALNFYEKFDYPKEKIDIIGVYLHFADWAKSGGTLFPDWYTNQPGYRNAALIYTVPQ